MKCPSSPGKKCSEAANVECWGLTPILSPMANYRAARALLGKNRNAGEGAAGLPKSSAKKGARKSAVKKAKTSSGVPTARKIDKKSGVTFS